MHDRCDVIVMDGRAEGEAGNGGGDGGGGDSNAGLQADCCPDLDDGIVVFGVLAPLLISSASVDAVAPGQCCWHTTTPVDDTWQILVSV